MSTPKRPKMRGSRKLMIAGLIILALGLGLSGLAKLLSGSTTDGRFASATRSLMPGKTDNERKQIGHQVCTSLSSGSSVTAIGIALNAQDGISLFDAATFIGDSVGAYCPSNRPLLGR